MFLNRVLPGLRYHHPLGYHMSDKKNLFELPVFQSKKIRSGSGKRPSLHTSNTCTIPPFFRACATANNIPIFFISFSLVNSLPSLFSFIFFHLIHFSNSPSGIDLNKICEADIVFHSVAFTLFMDDMDLSLEYGVVLISSY